MRNIVVIVLVAALWAAVTVGCEPGTAVPFENATTVTLTFFFEPGEDATVQFSLPPLETKTYTITRGAWTDRVIARDPSGEVVFDQRITWDELKHMERIVVEPDR